MCMARGENMKNTVYAAVRGLYLELQCFKKSFGDPEQREVMTIKVIPAAFLI
jgi:hypothetical protein